LSKPITFNGHNCTLAAPKGDEDRVTPLPIFRNGVQCVSAWELSPAELEEIARTGIVWLSVWSGLTQPPVYVGGKQQVRELTADNGVWKE
jgi:hypothetical protein